MEVNVIKIGNSRGIRLPARLLKQCGIDKKVEIIVDGSIIKLAPVRKVREDWEEAFKKAALRIHEDDPLIYDDSLDLHLLPEWKDKGNV